VEGSQASIRGPVDQKFLTGKEKTRLRGREPQRKKVEKVVVKEKNKRVFAQATGKVTKGGGPQWETDGTS